MNNHCPTNNHLPAVAAVLLFFPTTRVELAHQQAPELQCHLHMCFKYRNNAIRCNHNAIRYNHMQSGAIRCNHMQSDAIRCNQMQSHAITCNQSLCTLHGTFKKQVVPLPKSIRPRGQRVRVPRQNQDEGSTCCRERCPCIGC